MTHDVPHSAPASAHVNNVEIVYDTFGDPGARPMLLIMGIGAKSSGDFGGLFAWWQDAGPLPVESRRPISLNMP